MLTIEGHIGHTRKELTEDPYFIAVLTTLKNSRIVSYLDLGANIGEFCNVLFESVPTLKDAYLVEPEERNYNFLKSHIKNESVLYQVAIGYNFSSGVLVEDSNNVGGHRLNEIFYANGNFFKVDIKTLEELELPLVDFVKIDIEGGEFNVIENSTYLQQVGLIDVEFHGSIEVDYVKRYFPTHEVILYSHVGNTVRCFLRKK
jgi:FkbM family methyltransferase